MSNNIRQEINRIEIPKELSEVSKMGVSSAKKEMKKSSKRFYKSGIAVTASLLIIIGTFLLLENNHKEIATKDNQHTTILKNNDGLKIPALQLPKGESLADMIGLIVYNGKIYTQAKTEIDPKIAKSIKGDKLGTALGNINEWSKKKDYEKKFASSIGRKDIYTVKGYDKDFRIMTYGERDGKPYAEFYENLNGITVKSGEDVFGKFKMVGNVSNAQYKTFYEWNNNVNNYHPITERKVLMAFVKELNKTKPYSRTEKSNPIWNSRNNESLREVIIQLNDGTKVTLILLRGGYIYYGDIEVYFKMDDDIFSKMWSQLK